MDEHPVHHTVNCATGEVTVTPMSLEEVAAKAATRAALQAEQAAAAADEQALREAVAAHSDPIVKALAARLGLA